MATTEKRRNVDDLSERGMPRRSTSLFWVQKLPWNLEFSAAGYWQDKAKWSINTWAERYQRIDTRIAYPFRWSGVRGEVAWIIQSLNGAHFEYKHTTIRLTGSWSAGSGSPCGWITDRLRRDEPKKPRHVGGVTGRSRIGGDSRGG